MYKPQTPTLPELKSKQDHLMNQILNGANLGAPAMDRLVKALASVKAQIAEAEKETDA